MDSARVGPSIGTVISERRREIGLDLDILAELTGTGEPRLAALEGGEVEPSFDELGELSRFLGVDLELYDPEEDERPEPLPEIVTLLKSHEDYLPARDWGVVVEAAEIAREIVDLESMLGRPARLARLRERFQPRSLSNDLPWRQGQRLARRVRDELGLGTEPIDSIYGLADHLGVSIIEVLLPRSVSALGLVDEDHGPTIIVNVQGPNESLLPRRFAIAHELCHVLFDEYEMERLQRFDNAPGFFEGRDKPDIEKRADAFAIHFLCPEDATRGLWQVAERRDLALEERVREVIERFGVSFTAATTHLQNIRLLSSGQARSLSDVDTSAPADIRNAEQRARPTAYDPRFGPIPRLRRGALLELVLRARRRQQLTRSAAIQLLDIDGATFDDRVEVWTALLLD